MPDCNVAVVTIHVLVNSESVTTSAKEITEAVRYHPTVLDTQSSFQAVSPSFQEKVELGTYEFDGSFMGEVSSSATNVVVDHHGNTESSC